MTKRPALADVVYLHGAPSILIEVKSPRALAALRGLMRENFRVSNVPHRPNRFVAEDHQEPK